MLRLRRPRSPVLTLRRGGAAVLAGTALVLALRPAPPADHGPPPVPVIVAATDLPAGTVLTAAHLAPARFPPDLVPDGVTGEVEPLLGRVLAGGVRGGEPLTDARLVGPGLTAGLPANQVAAPVRLADVAVAALVRTGDRVDVLATPPEGSRADVVAEGALVVASSGTGRDGDPSAGLLLIAVDDATATRLAAVATTSTLTVSLPSPRGWGGP